MSLLFPNEDISVILISAQDVPSATHHIVAALLKTTALVSRVVYSIHFIDSVYAVYAQLFSPSYTLGVASSDLP